MPANNDVGGDVSAFAIIVPRIKSETSTEFAAFPLVAGIEPRTSIDGAFICYQAAQEHAVAAPDLDNMTVAHVLFRDHLAYERVHMLYEGRRTGLGVLISVP